MARHSDAQSVHKGSYVSATDPALLEANRVAPGKTWIDTSSPIPHKIFMRNDDDDDWIQIGGGGELDGDVEGMTDAAEVVAIRGIPVSATQPTANQVLARNPSSPLYEPKSIADLLPAIPLSGDVSGTNGANKVDKIKNRNVSLPAIPESLIETFDSSAAFNAAYNSEVNSGIKTIAGGLIKNIGEGNYYGENYLCFVQKTAYDFRGKTIEFVLANLTNPDHAVYNDFVRCGIKPSNTTSINPTNWGSWTGFSYKPFTDPTHIEVFFNYWYSNGGAMAETIEISGLATNFRLRDVAGVMNYDVKIAGVWQTIKSYDYAGEMNAAQYITGYLGTNNYKESAAFDTIITDLYTGEDQLLNDSILVFKTANNRFENVTKTNFLSGIAQTLDAGGDLDGTVADAKVIKIKNRALNFPEPPTETVDDDFSQTLFDEGVWEKTPGAPVDQYLANVGGVLRIGQSPSQNIAFEGIRTINAYDFTDQSAQLKIGGWAWTGSYLFFALYKDANNWARFWFMNNDNCYCQTKIAGNATENGQLGIGGLSGQIARFVHESAGNTLHFQTSADNGANWATRRSIGALDVSEMRPMIAYEFAAGGGGDYKTVDNFSTSIPLDDPLADDSMLIWNATDLEWQDITLEDLNAKLNADSAMPEGDLNATTNKIEKIQSRPLFIPAPSGGFFGDEFSAGDFDEGIWHSPNRTNGNQTSQSNGILTIADGIYIVSDQVFNLKGKSVTFDMGANPQGSALIGFALDNGGYIGGIEAHIAYYFSIAGVIQIRIGDGNNTNYTPASAASCRFMKIEITSDEMMIVSVSSDKQNWAEIFNRAIPEGQSPESWHIVISAVNSNFQINAVESNIATGDSLADQSLLWWNETNVRFEVVSLETLKTALDALP